MRLFCSSRSPFARKVRVAAIEAGLGGQIEMRPVLAIPTQPDPELLPLSPLCMIPVLETPQGPLFDSHVICDWLDQQSGGRLIPASGRERTLCLQREALADGLAEVMLAHRSEMRRSDACRQDRLLAAYDSRIQNALDWIEKQAATPLENADLGAIAVACVLAYADFRFPELDWREGRPAAAAWHGAFSTRPSMTATVYADEPPQPKP